MEEQCFFAICGKSRARLAPEPSRALPVAAYLDPALNVALSRPQPQPNKPKAPRPSKKLRRFVQVLIGVDARNTFKQLMHRHYHQLAIVPISPIPIDLGSCRWLQLQL